MKLFVVALIIFLIAFAGLGIGLIVRRRGIRSGCGHKPISEYDCRCESELDASMKAQVGCSTRKMNDEP
jgi:hypothetical protein